MDFSRSLLLILFVATVGCGSGVIHDGSGQDGATGSAGNNAGSATGASTETGAGAGGTNASTGGTGIVSTGAGVSTTTGTGLSTTTGIGGTGTGANTGVGGGTGTGANTGIGGAGASTSPGTGGTSATPACGVDTWTNYAMAEFSTHCESCHTFAGSLMGVQSQASQIKSMVSNGTMPPTGALDGNDVARIVTWINCGLPN